MYQTLTICLATRNTTTGGGGLHYFLFFIFFSFFSYWQIAHMQQMDVILQFFGVKQSLVTILFEKKKGQWKI